MKNIPMFTTSQGVATLVLREIPWSGNAYVLVRSVWNGQAEGLLAECRDFCRAVNAQRIYASWELEPLPAALAYEMLAMECPKAVLPPPERPVALEVLSRENGEAYLEIYNRCFREVPAAASYGPEDLDRLLGQDKAWLAQVDGRYAAVAELSEEGLEGVAVLPEFRGLGNALLRTVLPMVPRKTIALKVASTNLRARALYEKLGFRTVGVSRRWWKL